MSGLSALKLVQAKREKGNSPKQLQRYTPVSIDAAHDELLHRQRIADEERKAMDYFSTCTH